MKHIQYSKSLILTLLVLLVSTMAFAQKGRSSRVHELKVTYINDRLDMSASQKDRFWPVYHRYEAELRGLRQSFRKQYANKDNRTNAEARTMIEENLDFQESVIALKRRYKNEFLKVISAQQLATLYEAEREFKQMLIKRLQGRQKRR